MPLIDFKTDLTSLPWGGDRRDGGSSNEPYNRTDIPQGLSSDNLPNNAPDFILRNGLRGVTTAAEDVGRLTKMFFDTKSPKGLQFTVKQNLLSRTSVKTEASKGPAYFGGALNQGAYNPLNTIAQAGVNNVGIHLDLFGLGDGVNKYEDTVKNQPDSKNRLVLLNQAIFPDGERDTGNTQLQERFINEGTGELLAGLENATRSPIGKPLKKLVQQGLEALSLPGFGNGYRLNQGNNVLSYQGGPGADLGIGRTNIRFADQRTGVNNINGKEIVEGTYQVGRKRPWDVDFRNFLGASVSASLSFDDNGIIPNTGQLNKAYGRLDYNSTLSTSPLQGIINANNSYLYTQEQINTKAESVIGDDQGQYPSDFREELLEGKSESTVLSLSPDYQNKNVDVRTHRGNPGAKNDVYNYGVTASTLTALDKINALPMYESTWVDTSKAVNDLCKFRIAALDNSGDGTAVYMHFRAFLDNFDDNYNATWNPVNYVGRGDTLYNYSGFTRTIGLGFTAFAQSKAELIPMYKKLNYLASTLTPDYNQAGFMRGNLLRLTVGGYLYETPGFITNLTYNVPQESPWEIAINENGAPDYSVKELPHMIKCSFSFTPIHKFLPQRPGSANNPSSEHYISLDEGVQNSYRKNNYPTIDYDKDGNRVDISQGITTINE